MADDEREEREVVPKTREAAQQAAALDRVTDQVRIGTFPSMFACFTLSEMTKSHESSLAISL